MSNINDREKALENKYALDQEVMFRIEARAVKLFALWLAEEMGMTGDDAKVFAGSIVSANLDEQGFEDVKRAVRPHIEAKNLDLNDHMIDVKLNSFMETAKEQILSEKR